ncbi:hypothetical protein Btru_030075 [Bulinus truncatus]|nr:hypothetical protein Btru_030075 [Bulinus truncatus]
MPVDGRVYGTWITRYIHRACRQSVCMFRENNCMDVNSETYQNCNIIYGIIAAQGCSLKMCKRDEDMMCAGKPPGPDFTQVESDSCALGQMCYRKEMFKTDSAGVSSAPKH